MFYHPLRFAPDHSVVLETDICDDVDDVGALALLLAESRRHGFGLSGININCPVPVSAAAVAAILRSRGFDGVPIGQSAVKDDQTSSYLPSVAALLPDEARAKLSPKPSRQFYKEILEVSADHSLTIISIGFLQVLDQVWREDPSLFERKVDTVLVMGGSFLFEPGYREFNVARCHRAEAGDFLNNYPGPVVFVGFELGYDIFTDLSPKACREDDPVVAAYRAYSTKAEGTATCRRNSWDPVTVDFAVHGEGARYRLSPSIRLQLVDGVCHFHEDPCANRAFVIPNQDSETIGNYLSRRILEEIPPTA